jgi:hypothetical protein
LLRDPARGHALARAGRAHALRIATLSKTVADLDALYRDALFRNGRRRAGYRWWVSLARLPVVIAVTFYLNGRYVVLESTYLPKWAAGWRPWQPRALAVLPFELMALPFVVLAPRACVTGVRRAYYAVRRRIGVRRTYHWLRRRIGVRRTYHWLRRRIGVRRTYHWLRRRTGLRR